MEDNKSYLLEAFKAFDDLKEEVFDITIADGLQKAKEYDDKMIDDTSTEVIIDPLAADEEEVKDSYIGKAILKCSICQSMIYKNPEEVVIDEDAELANVGEYCPYCQSEDGYYIIGQVEEFCDKECEHDKEECEEESKEVSEDEVEVNETEDKEDIDESLKTENSVKIEESDKPAATSIEDAQKWVDFDMKRYGKISERTNRLVRKAGFQIIKDNHGDYEVAAGKFESLNDKEYENAKKQAEKRAEKETLKQMIKDREKGSLGDRIEASKLKKDLEEDFQKVDIETDKEKMSMTADPNGKVTVTTEPKTEEITDTEVEEKEEVIKPISDETKAEFKSSEEPEEVEYDFDEFEESDFDELGESYLKRVYENVQSFKTTRGSINGNKLKLEGLITFKSGKQAKTNFVFESYKATKTGKLKFIGENKQFAKGKKSFTLSGRADGKKLVCEGLTYNYVAKSADGKSKRLYGTVRK